MKGTSNSSNRTFLSAGAVGYRAPSPHKQNIETVVRQIRQDRVKLMRNQLTLEQAALEQERTEQHFERLAKVVDSLIEVLKPLEVGTVVTDQWIRERDQAIVRLQEILSETQQNESQ